MSIAGRGRASVARPAGERAPYATGRLLPRQRPGATRTKERPPPPMRATVTEGRSLVGKCPGGTASIRPWLAFAAGNTRAGCAPGGRCCPCRCQGVQSRYFLAPAPHMGTSGIGVAVGQDRLPHRLSAYAETPTRRTHAGMHRPAGMAGNRACRPARTARFGARWPRPRHAAFKPSEAGPVLAAVPDFSLDATRHCLRPGLARRTPRRAFGGRGPGANDSAREEPVCG